jgi:hypothetical protein
LVRIAKNSEGPKTPRALSGRLTRIATAVRKISVEITRPKMTDLDSRHAYRR